MAARISAAFLPSLSSNTPLMVLFTPALAILSHSLSLSLFSPPFFIFFIFFFIPCSSSSFIVVHGQTPQRLARLNLFSLEKRRLRGKKILSVLQSSKGITNVEASKMFSIDNAPRTRSNGVKLRGKQVKLDYTNFSSLMTW